MNRIESKQILLANSALLLLKLSFIDFPIVLVKSILSVVLGIFILLGCWAFLVPMTLLSAGYFLIEAVILISRHDSSKPSTSSEPGEKREEQSSNVTLLSRRER